MPIRRFLESGSSYEPDDLKIMSDAFERARKELGIKDRNSEAARRLALRIITIARYERDPAKLCKNAVEWYSRQAVPA
jgi:hypothetical protein